MSSSSFARNSSFEDACVRKIKTYFDAAIVPRQPDLAMVLIKREDDRATKQGLETDLQKSVGDAILVRNGLFHKTVDFKCERRASRNFFIETHSNFDLNRHSPGWIHHLRTDEIWYYFDETEEFFRLSLPGLRTWLSEVVEDPGRPPSVRLMTFHERLQVQHAQKNRTVGRLVPIDQVRRAGPSVFLGHYRLRDIASAA